MAIYRDTYYPATGCNGDSQGARALQAWWTGAYGNQGAVNLGVCNCRRIAGTNTWSLHAECRAGDLGTAPYGNPPGSGWPGWGWQVFDKLRRHSNELGIQLIIFDRKVWSCLHPDAGWRTYAGSNPHTGHGHVELTPTAASSLTAATIQAEIGGTASPPSQPRPAPGPRHPFPLPAGHYFGPKNGPARSVSGFYGRRFNGRTDRAWLQEFGTQLARRGWPAGKGRRYLGRHGNDGYYGPEYRTLTRAFQADQNLTVDGLIGPRTWHAAFHNPVT